MDTVLLTKIQFMMDGYAAQILHNQIIIMKALREHYRRDALVQLDQAIEQTEQLIVKKAGTPAGTTVIAPPEQS